VVVVLIGPFAVFRLSERVHDATEQRFADRHLRDASGTPDLVALLDLLLLAEDRDADVVLLEVQDDAVDGVRELDELAGGRPVEAVDARDAVAADSTVPVSRTSSCFSNSLICSRMMSLISAARICIVASPLTATRRPRPCPW
jgi:hypothetical protein